MVLQLGLSRSGDKPTNLNSDLFSCARLNQGDKRADLNDENVQNEYRSDVVPPRQRPPGGASTAVASRRGLHGSGGMQKHFLQSKGLLERT
jgi:hypothetical protein